MAYIEVDIDIEDHLDEVDTDDLVRELKSRGEDGKIISSIMGASSLRDISKIEAFIDKFKDIPESELDDFLNRY